MDGMYYGISMEDANDSIVDHCVIHDMHGAFGDDCHGIFIAKGDDIDVTNCTCYDNEGDGVVVAHDYEHTNILIEDCTFYISAPAIAKCCENGVDIKAGDGVTIRGNWFYGFRWNDGTCGSSGGSKGEAIIIHNFGGGITTTNILIEENEIYDSTIGIAIQNGPNGVTIQKNIIRDSVDEASTTGEECFIFLYASDNIDIFNNTFHNAAVDSFVIDSCTGVVFENNIINDGGTLFGAPDTYDYNGWFTCVATWAGVNDTTGADPLFVDEAGDNYHLTCASPCVDAGTDVGLPYICLPDLGRWESTCAIIVMVYVVVVAVVVVMI
jgi:parallel beta-helix repeat protein